MAPESLRRPLPTPQQPQCDEQDAKQRKLGPRLQALPVTRCSAEKGHLVGQNGLSVSQVI